MRGDAAGVTLPSPEDGKLRIYAFDFPNGPAHIEEGYEPPAIEEAPGARFATGRWSSYRLRRSAARQSTMI